MAVMVAAFACAPANSPVFLPLATSIWLADLAMALASFLPSLRLAGTISRASIPLTSRNPDARVQLVHPLRE